MIFLSRCLYFSTCLLGLLLCVACAELQTVTVNDPNLRPYAVFREDQRIVRELTRLYRSQRVVRNTRIDIISFNRRVVLMGEAPNTDIHKQIIAIARDHPLVDYVYDQVTIAPPRPSDYAALDLQIMTALRQKLLWHPHIIKERVVFRVDQQNIYLMGWVDHKMAEAVVAVAQTLKGVREIHVFFEIL